MGGWPRYQKIDLSMVRRTGRFRAMYVCTVYLAFLQVGTLIATRIGAFLYLQCYHPCHAIVRVLYTFNQVNIVYLG
jgi:hypothetical protein